MVYVTHDQSEALSMADRVAVMSNGKVAQVGAPREIYNRPAGRFVADFIGETNLIRGRIMALGDNAIVETAAGKLVAATVYEGAAVDDAVWCSIRPERLDVTPESEERPNMLSGEVVRVVYLGSHEQYFVKLADGTELKAVEYDARVAKAAAGKTVRLGCDASDVVALRT